MPFLRREPVSTANDPVPFQASSKPSPPSATYVSIPGAAASSVLLLGQPPPKIGCVFHSLIRKCSKTQAFPCLSSPFLAVSFVILGQPWLPITLPPRCVPTDSSLRPATIVAVTWTTPVQQSAHIDTGPCVCRKMWSGIRCSQPGNETELTSWRLRIVVS